MHLLQSTEFQRYACLETLGRYKSPSFRDAPAVPRNEVPQHTLISEIQAINQAMEGQKLKIDETDLGDRKPDTDLGDRKPTLLITTRFLKKELQFVYCPLHRLPPITAQHEQYRIWQDQCAIADVYPSTRKLSMKIWPFHDDGELRVSEGDEADEVYINEITKRHNDHVKEVQDHTSKPLYSRVSSH